MIKLLEAFRLTVQHHKELDPKLWSQDGQLDRNVRDRLLDLSIQFAKFSGIDQTRVKDVVFTGSTANYNYTKHSDVDVHVMCDGCANGDEALYQKKVEWHHLHKDTVMGYPVELYIQSSTDHFPAGQGVYSLLRNEWVIQPQHVDKVEILKDKKFVSKVKHAIDYMERFLLSTATKQDILDYKTKLWKWRSAGLEKAGEWDIANLLYKELRNRGLIQRLNDRLHELSL